MHASLLALLALLARTPNATPSHSPSPSHSHSLSLSHNLKPSN